MTNSLGAEPGRGAHVALRGLGGPGVLGVDHDLERRAVAALVQPGHRRAGRHAGGGAAHAAALDALAHAVRGALAQRQAASVERQRGIEVVRVVDVGRPAQPDRGRLVVAVQPVEVGCRQAPRRAQVEQRRAGQEVHRPRDPAEHAGDALDEADAHRGPRGLVVGERLSGGADGHELEWRVAGRVAGSHRLDDDRLVAHPRQARRRLHGAGVGLQAGGGDRDDPAHARCALAWARANTRRLSGRATGPGIAAQGEQPDRHDDPHEHGDVGPGEPVGELGGAQRARRRPARGRPGRRPRPRAPARGRSSARWRRRRGGRPRRSRGGGRRGAASPARRRRWRSRARARM